MHAMSSEFDLNLVRDGSCLGARTRKCHRLRRAGTLDSHHQETVHFSASREMHCHPQYSSFSYPSEPETACTRFGSQDIGSHDSVHSVQSLGGPGFAPPVFERLQSTGLRSNIKVGKEQQKERLLAQIKLRKNDNTSK